MEHLTTGSHMKVRSLTDVSLCLDVTSQIDLPKESNLGCQNAK